MKNMRYHKESGFTLIELLTVIIIIGILAAVAVPIFSSQRSRAQDSQTVSDVRNIVTAAETFLSDRSKTVGDITGQSVLEYASSKNVKWEIKGYPQTGGYCIAAFNDSGKQYKSTSTLLTYDSTGGGFKSLNGSCGQAAIGGSPKTTDATVLTPTPTSSTGVGSDTVTPNPSPTPTPTSSPTSSPSPTETVATNPPPYTPPVVASMSYVGRETTADNGLNANMAIDAPAGVQTGDLLILTSYQASNDDGLAAYNPSYFTSRGWTVLGMQDSSSGRMVIAGQLYNPSAPVPAAAYYSYAGIAAYSSPTGWQSLSNAQVTSIAFPTNNVNVTIAPSQRNDTFLEFDALVNRSPVYSGNRLNITSSNLNERFASSGYVYFAVLGADSLTKRTNNAVVTADNSRTNGFHLTLGVK